MANPLESRRNFLKLAASAAGIAVGTYILRNDISAVVGAIEREFNPQNSADVVHTDEVVDQFIFDSDVKQLRQSPRVESGDSNEKQPLVDTKSEYRANGYNLWETINLASSNEQRKFPILLIVVDNGGRVIVGSNAWPMSYSSSAFDQFQNPVSYRTLSYIPKDRPIYRNNPHTWTHSGNYNNHRFFAGKFEETLRMTPERRNQTTADTLVVAKDNFHGATAYLCQAKYEDAFKMFWDIKPSIIQKVLNTFPGNVLTMSIASMLRVPPDRLSEYAGKVVTSDPLPWMEKIAPEIIGLPQDQLTLHSDPPTLGWGWESVLSKSRWYLAFCSGSTLEERKANGDVFHIDESEWVVGFEIVDRKQRLNPFVV